MRNVLRAILSIFLAVELLFGAAVAGVPVRTALPEAPTGTYGRYVNAFVA